MKGGSHHSSGRGDGADNTPAYDLRLLRRLWQFIRPHRRLLLVAAAMLPLASAFNLVQPYLVKVAIDEAIAPKQGPADLALLGPLMLALITALMLERMAQFGEMLLMQLCGQRAMHDLRVAAHRHLLSLRSAFFDRTPVGKLMTRVTNDVESITEAFSMGLVSVLGDLITLTGILAVMLWMSPRLALVSLAAVPFLMIFVELFRRMLRRTHRLIRKRLAQINATLQEHIMGMNVVQIFGQQRRAAARFDVANREHRDAYISAIRYDSSLFALVEMIGSVTIALLLWYGGLRVLADDKEVTLGLLVAFIEYVQKFFIPIRDMSAKYTVMQQSMAASERVFQLLDTKESEPGVVAGAEADAEADADAGADAGAGAGAGADAEADAGTDAEAGADAKARAATPLVEFDNVSFHYSEGQPVLQGLSFVVEQGQSVALVGATGAGKSTVVRLLTRLYETQSGGILLGGRPVQSMELAAIRRRVVVVNQDVFMFAGSVADNISLGAPEITRRRLEAAAERVGLTRFLELGQPVLEQGSNLSAGEQQLVAFARALARDPEVLVLDEATASVDPESERVIQDGIAELTRQRTSIIVAHRLSTIEQVDQVLVLRRGRLEEQGPHHQLLAAGGLYARLHELQYVSPAGPQKQK